MPEELDGCARMRRTLEMDIFNGFGSGVITGVDINEWPWGGPFLDLRNRDTTVINTWLVKRAEEVDSARSLIKINAAGAKKTKKKERRKKRVAAKQKSYDYEQLERNAPDASTAPPPPPPLVVHPPPPPPENDFPMMGIREDSLAENDGLSSIATFLVASTLCGSQRFNT